MSRNPPYEVLLGEVKMFGTSCLTVAIKIEDLPKFKTARGKAIPKEVVPLLKKYSAKSRVGAIIDSANRILQLVILWKLLDTTREVLERFEELISSKGEILFGAKGIMTYSFK